MELTGMMKAWIADLIDTAINDAKIGIENEQTWAEGSRTTEEKLMHEANVRENQTYVEFLENLKKQHVG